MAQHEELVKPVYDSPYSLYGLACGLAAFFGVKRDCLTRPLELAGRRLALVYLDALSWNLFEKASPQVSGKVIKATTVFPSTTSAALATLMTAQTPGEHGLLGYQVYNKLLGGVVNLIKYSYAGEQAAGTLSQVRPLSEAFPVRPWLAETEAKVHAIMSSGASSGELTRAFLQLRPSEGLTTIRPYNSPYEMLALLREAASEGSADLIYVYYDNPDHVGHIFGFESGATDLIVEEVREVVNHLDSIARSYGDRYTFVLMSDHGQVTVTRTFVFNDDADLLRRLEVPPYGDSRAVWFRSREDVGDVLRSRYGMVVFSRSEVEGEGLLGRVDDFVRSNVMGDFLGVAPDRSTKYLYLYRPNDASLRLKGNHSGMSDDEMHIPIIVWG